MSSSAPVSLSPDLAARLCQEVQDSQWIKVFTQCWGCITFSKGDPANMCGAVVACNQVMTRYEKLKAKGEL